MELLVHSLRLLTCEEALGAAAAHPDVLGPSGRADGQRAELASGKSGRLEESAGTFPELGGF